MKRFEFLKGGAETSFEDGDCMARAINVVSGGAISYPDAREFCLGTIRDIEMVDFMETRNREGHRATFGDWMLISMGKAAATRGVFSVGTPVTKLFLSRMADLGFVNHQRFGEDGRLVWLNGMPQTGRWLVTTQDHASSFIDGRVVDLFDWQVEEAYRVNGLYEAWEWKS